MAKKSVTKSRRNGFEAVRKQGRKFRRLREIHVILILVIGLFLIIGLIYILFASSSPSINPISPAANSVQNFSVVLFNATVYGGTSGVSNVSLYINSVFYAVNSSRENDTWYSFAEKLPAGNYSWYYESCDNSGNCFQSTSSGFSLVPLDEWNMFGKTPGHSGDYLGSINLSHFTKLWSYILPGALFMIRSRLQEGTPMWAVRTGTCMHLTQQTETKSGTTPPKAIST